MAYNVILTDGSGNIVIPLKQVSTNLASIPLVGREHSGYGQAIATAQIRMLENFANTTSPPNPLIGQLWYDKGQQRLKVYDTTVSPVWRPLPVTLSELEDVDTPSPGQDQILRYDAIDEQWLASDEATAGVNRFTELLDTPGTALQPNAFLRVNPLGSQIQYINTIPAAQISGTLNVANIPDLSANKITTDQFTAARIPSLDAGKITTGEFVAARIPRLNADKINEGFFEVDRIPRLNADKINEGTFTLPRLPPIPPEKISTTDGEFGAGLIPNLDASKITTGAFVADRIPGLPASRITSGVIENDRLPASAKRSEIPLANLTNKDSSFQGFITGSVFIDALKDALKNPVVAAALTYGSVGTYVYGIMPRTGEPAEIPTGTTDIGVVEGRVYKGSTIYPSGGFQDGSQGSPDSQERTHNMVWGGATLQGSWRAMGRVNKNPTDSRWRQTLFLRIS